MIKRGDFVKCTTDTYSITNRDTVCLVINDFNSWEELCFDRISVMVVEDYSSNRGFKGIGCIYTVKREHFEKIDYIDEQKRDRERTHKMIMKLANCKIPLTREKITSYASERQLATHFSHRKGNIFYLSYVEDCVLKVYEISLDIVTDEAKHICFHEINCLDVKGTFDYGDLKTIETLLQRNEKNVKTTKLFEKKYV